MKQDIAGEAACAQSGKLGMELQALQRITCAKLRIHVGRTVDRLYAEFLLDKESKPVNDLVGPTLGAAEIAQCFGGHAPRACGSAAKPNRDHRVTRVTNRWPVTGWRDAFHGRKMGDASYQSALAKAILDDCPFGRDGIDICVGISRRHALTLNVARRQLQRRQCKLL